jgi:GT2 family glycosyltransferase
MRPFGVSQGGTLRGKSAMLTVLVPFRNTKQLAANCLMSLLETFSALRFLDQVEFIFTDDASDPGLEMVPLLQKFRESVPSAVTIVAFTERQHYTRACAHGLARARGSQVLFVSHDMILTPDCVRALLAVAALDDRFGVVRATSQYVDCLPHHSLAPPLALRSLRDVFAFSRLVAESNGLQWMEDPFLTGDVMLIQRAVLDRIGVMDQRYFGYFGDIDFGLRCQRAGFLLVCAKGAWLSHEGFGYYKDEAARTQQEFEKVHAARMHVVNAAYGRFREKWDPSLPELYPGIKEIDFARLRTLPEVPFSLHEPAPVLTPEIGRLV